ncbi:hypothetical protein [Nonomuraea sp. NPDC049309]|uniref:hypothetical protein n=1 Tax=Nonomuraea sp. NPDC049309 TaxID=3364350 RepID=UPI003719AAB1
MEIDHSIMRNSGASIHDSAIQFGMAAGRIRGDLEPLLPHFGDPESDEAARIFRHGTEGHPGFDDALEDLDKALRNLVESYKAIGQGVVAMSTNVKAAEWASMIDKNAYLRNLIEFARRGDGDIPVPSTNVELE